MKQKFLTTLLVLTCMALNASAQALSERYNEKRKVVVVGDNNHNLKVARVVMEHMGIPTEYYRMGDSKAVEALEAGRADVALTAQVLESNELCLSKSIVGYTLLGANTVGSVRFVGVDRQLIEQIDDAYARLRQDGDIAEVNKRRVAPMLRDKAEVEAAIMDMVVVLLVLAGVFVVIGLLILWHARLARRRTKEVREMIAQTERMNKCYEIADNQAAHDLVHKYEAILCNPFVALAFYDNNGQLIVQNEAMKRIGHRNLMDHRKPLYNAECNVDNYLVSIKL